MIGWLDCRAGASGDMLLGTLVDAGAPLPVLQAAVDRLDVEPITLSVREVERAGIGALKVDVQVSESRHHRTWATIRGLLEPLDPPVRALAEDVFARLARAEGAAHRVAAEDVHFHEVGALDALADVVGAAAGLVHLGLTALHASPVSLGSGQSRGAHGPIPVPGPAVLALLAEAGAPVQAGPSPYEACTPTGAAILAAAVSEWGPLPPMTVSQVGVGAGGRDPAEVANVLRLVLGSPAETGGRAVLIESNVDDLDPRLWPDVIEKLLAAGASDAWLTPILMKKGRPAHTLHVLCRPDRAAAVREEVFRRTSTIGVRQRTEEKYALDRSYGSVTVHGRAVGVKTARLDGEVVNVSVEYEDARRAAEETGIPLKEVLRAATSEAHRLG